jgi:predicted dehydrogenase
MEDTVKVALVGTGNVARRSYLPHLAKMQDVTLSYQSRTRAKAEELARQYGGRVADSLPDLMADDPDAVLVLTREEQRFDVAMALLEFQPRRLFFEKPLVAQNGQANVVEDDFFKAREILRRAGRTGTETAMVFNYRFFDQTALARRLVAERNLGRPVHFTALVNYACWSHCIDLVLLFAGPPAELTALRSRQERVGFARASDVVAAVRTEGDATGTLIGTTGIPFDMPLYELTVAFERGRFSTRDLDGDLEFLDYEAKRHEVHALTRNVSRWDQYQASFGKALAAYLDSVRQAAPPPVPGLAGLRELQMEAAIRRSIAQGRPVRVAEEFPVE